MKAATLVNSSFDLNPNTAVDTTGTADWGYFVEGVGFTDGMTTGVAVNFDDLTFDDGPGPSAATVSESSPGIGEVLYTPTDTSDGTGTADTIGFTFDGNNAGQRLHNIGGDEEIFSMKFNDLGAGTHTMTFYAGHDNNSREMDIDYFVYEEDDAETSATLSGTGLQSGGLVNGRGTYTLEFSTATANTDIVFNLGSAGSGVGAWTLSGYTLTTVAVPEPSSFALLAGCFGLTWVMLRRR
ncbi:hypothetical protein DDZ13_02960 [Coraliomargarita sinensis]|uniref:PEP-CTERM protein-sorting domain-containing protein n=2 Tax=Coraliomargarita sinensis TaxID=2174842 RepID=A0A317ZNH5_9BACT|nr:hypothetical protein DDZ13_02960 [Coraliomargarita sinensis]